MTSSGPSFGAAWRARLSRAGLPLPEIARVNLASIAPLTLLLALRSEIDTWWRIPQLALLVAVLANVNYAALRLLLRALRRLPRMPWLLHYLVHGLLLLPLFALVDALLDRPVVAVLAPELLRTHWYVGFAALLSVLYALEVRALELYQQRQSQALVRQQQLERARRAAEGTAYGAQLKPHFVFNALNTIAALVHEDPQRAERTTLDLARLMRQLLEIQDGTLVDLRSEVSVARAYLEIERARLGERLRFTLEVPEALLDTPLPALVVQPLVENAVQHGVRQRREGGHVRLRAWAEDGLCHVEVADDGPGFSSHQGAGRATRLVQERLDRAYDGQAALRLVRDTAAGLTLALLTFPLSFQPMDEAEDPGRLAEEPA